MKKHLKDFLRPTLRILTEIPGWPDAPRCFRVRRALPIVVPIAAIALLLLWHFAWTLPRIQREMTAQLPMQALAQEVADLQLSGTELQTIEVATRAAEANKQLLAKPSQLPATLEKLRDSARALGWQATLHPMTGSPTPLTPDARVYFLNARGKLTATTDNVQPFPTLLDCLDRLSSSAPWIDLLRLTLRADEKGRHSVEVNLRVGCLVPHEKIPE